MQRSYPFREQSKIYIRAEFWKVTANRFITEPSDVVNVNVQLLDQLHRRGKQEYELVRQCSLNSKFESPEADYKASGTRGATK